MLPPLCLITGAIYALLEVPNRGQAQTTPPLLAEQSFVRGVAQNKPLADQQQPLKPLEQSFEVTSPTSPQLRLNVEGVLNEKSRFRVNGQLADAYTATGKPGEKLTVRLRSSEFDPYLLILEADQKLLLGQDNDSGGGTSARVEITLPVTGAYTVIVMSHQPKVTGRYQLEVWDEAYQKAALTDAEQLDAQIRLFVQQRKFDEATPLAEKALAIRNRILGRSFNTSFSLNITGSSLPEAETLWRSGSPNQRGIGNR